MLFLTIGHLHRHTNDPVTESIDHLILHGSQKDHRFSPLSSQMPHYLSGLSLHHCPCLWYFGRTLGWPGDRSRVCVLWADGVRPGCSDREPPPGLLRGARERAGGRVRRVVA